MFPMIASHFPTIVDYIISNHSGLYPHHMGMAQSRSTKWATTLVIFNRKPTILGDQWFWAIPIREQLAPRSSPLGGRRPLEKSPSWANPGGRARRSWPPGSTWPWRVCRSNDGAAASSWSNSHGITGEWDNMMESWDSNRGIRTMR